MPWVCPGVAPGLPGCAWLGIIGQFIIPPCAAWPPDIIGQFIGAACAGAWDGGAGAGVGGDAVVWPSAGAVCARWCASSAHADGPPSDATTIAAIRAMCVERLMDCSCGPGWRVCLHRLPKTDAPDLRHQGQLSPVLFDEY